MRYLYLLFAFMAVGSMLLGCGGSGSSETSNPTPSFAVLWGARNRAIDGPSSALSVTLTIEPKTGVSQTWTVDRPSDPDIVLQEITAPQPMSRGRVVILAHFFSQPGGAGDLVGEAATMTEIPENGFMDITIATQSRIVRTAVVADQSMQVDTPGHLHFTAFSSEGHVVAVSRESAFWAVTGGDAILTFDGTRAVPTGFGEVDVVVSVDHVASAPETVTVNPVPSIEILPLLPGMPANSAMFANDMSSDGRFIVGTNNATPYRWSQEHGTESLGTVPGFSGVGEAYAVSADGKTVCGMLVEGSALTEGATTHAFVWTEAGGMVLLDQPEGATNTVATDVSADGSKIVGYATGDTGASLSCLWEPGKEVVTFFPGQAHSISGDGLVIGGQLEDPTVGYLWYGPGLFIRLEGTTPEQNMSSAAVLSHDGSVAGGRSLNADLAPAYYTPGTGIVVMLGTTLTTVYAMSADGQMMGGGAPEPGISFIFDSAHGLRNFGMTLVSFDDVFGTNLVESFQGRAPGILTGISANKMVIAGTAYPSGGVGTVRAFRYTGPNLSKLNLR